MQKALSGLVITKGFFDEQPLTSLNFVELRLHCKTSGVHFENIWKYGRLWLAMGLVRKQSVKNRTARHNFLKKSKVFNIKFRLKVNGKICIMQNSRPYFRPNISVRSFNLIYLISYLPRERDLTQL